MKKMILAAMAAAMLFTAPSMASAEDAVDMSKLSCKEFIRACLETHLSIMKRFSSMLAMAI